ncbi:MAG: hypothetical protein LUH04_07550 [Clostridium sp.]|nr:hypothetical protein [Enterocloster asparagiformis]MCD7907521.1 hypothetical protein [Clostridium sp.]
MNTILEQLEQEEITVYKKELRQYLDEIPDQYFYEFFNIRSMTDPIYDGISRDLMTRGYYALLARFSEHHKNLKRFIHEYN